jgi:hypothetical protein
METTTIEVSLTQPNYDQLVRLAEAREQSVARLIEDLATDFIETQQARAADYQAMEAAQTRYAGEYVAIRHGQIIAHADKADRLLKIVRDDHGLYELDVLLAKIEASSLTVRHPRLRS